MQILKESEDRLSCEYWGFNETGSQLLLSGYGFMERKSTRHKYRVISKWSGYDERAYYSDLSRPTDIPDWVIREAVSQTKIRVYIGRTNDEGLYKEIAVTPVTL